MKKLTFAAAAVLLALAACAAQPLTYEEVVALPPEAQFDALKSASPEEHAAIFRAHMLHLAASQELTEEQRAAVRRAAAEVTRADYEPHARAAWDERAEAASYAGAIRRAFGEQAGRVLYSLQ
jgi:hypothetical protein